MTIPTVDGASTGLSRAVDAVADKPDSATHDLFQSMAHNAQANTQHMSPGQLGATLSEHLDGFVQRTTEFERASNTSVLNAKNTNPAEHASPASSLDFQPAEASASRSDAERSTDMDVALRSLGGLKQTFAHAMEVTLVSRSATQVSSSIQSLLKGQ